MRRFWDVFDLLYAVSIVALLIAVVVMFSIIAWFIRGGGDD